MTNAPCQRTPGRCRSWTAAGLAAVMATLGWATPGLGQTIEGLVSDSISTIPVGRGFIVLVDETGRETVRDLTGPDGRFSLPAPGPGVYRLRSERIGYRVWESAPIRAVRGHAYVVNPSINALPRRLASIEVTARSECEQRKGPDTGLLWDEARKALAAASWSAEQEFYVHMLHHAERELDRSRDEILAETITLHTVREALPFASRSAAELADSGYITMEPGGWEYWGPDANVILDPTFHETHCFWAVRGEGERRGQIGLAFEPTPGRRLPDVEGVLWLDETSGQLRTVEFGYTNIPMGVRADDIGGWATFMPMPSGAWILDRWEIRIPILTRRRFRRARVSGFRDVSGGVFRVTTLDGTEVYRAPDLATIRGTVYDSTSGGPLIGDVVSVVGTEYADTTDVDGRFVLRALLDREYQLTTRRIDWLGYERGRQTATFTPGDTLDVAITVPSLATVHRSLCRRVDIAVARVIHGEVREAGRLAIRRAEVVARWEPGVERKTRTDDDGRFVLCDLPADSTMTISVKHDDYDHTPIEATFVGRDVVIGTAAGQSSHYAPDRIVRLGLEMTRRR